MEKKILHVGMDVHKKSIDVAITDERANGKVRSYGKIDGTLEALDKLIRKLKSNASNLHFVYEAGPCGYPIYRHLTSEGHNCSVVAPSLVPRRSGDRIKTDRRDALNLVRLFRAGELTSISMYRHQKTRPCGICCAAVLTLGESNVKPVSSCWLFYYAMGFIIPERKTGPRGI